MLGSLVAVRYMQSDVSTVTQMHCLQLICLFPRNQYIMRQKSFTFFINCSSERAFVHCCLVLLHWKWKNTEELEWYVELPLSWLQFVIVEGFFVFVFFLLTVIFVICVLQQSAKPSVSYTEMKGAFSRGVNCVLSCDVCVMSVSVGLGCLFFTFLWHSGVIWNI